MKTNVTSWLTCGALLLGSGAAWAQTTATGQGPLVLEKVQNGPVGAPDVKITEVDGRVGTLIGGYGGWLSDHSLLVGGGAYWLADGRDGTGMWYGGLVLGWTLNGGGRVGVGARGLLGAGEATLGDTVTYRLPPYPVPHGGTGSLTTARFMYDRGFFIAEPQVNVVVRLARSISLDSGVGYRFVDASEFDNNRLHGVTGSIAIRFGGGS